MFLTIATPRYLDLALGQAPGAYNQAHRNADEVGIFELYPRTLVPIVVEDLDAQLPQLIVEIGRPAQLPARLSGFRAITSTSKGAKGSGQMMPSSS